LHPILRTLTLAAGSLFLISIAAGAQASRFSALYVFGDSYDDVGNLYTFFNGQTPTSPYYHGRFSNGPIWVDHVAGFLGLPLVASSLGGTDYAWAGAKVTGYDEYIPSVPQQISQYLAGHDGRADPDALFIIEGGINDVLRSNLDNPNETGFQIARGIANCEEELRKAGAHHFLIPDLLDVGLLPASAEFASSASAASSATNKWLEKLLAADETREGNHILRFDVFRVVSAIGKDPTHFGFINITDPCNTTTLCADPDHWFFFDSLHPSEFVHADFAIAVETILATRNARSD
jgi:phospholipase/lecithinase/hemolysin